MEETEVSRKSPFKRSGIRKEMKERSNYQVGEDAVSECIELMEKILGLMICIAKNELNEENDIHKRNGSPVRKTLHDIDINNAFDSIVILHNSEDGLNISKVSNFVRIETD